jgi:hypothetical protein
MTKTEDANRAFAMFAEMVLGLDRHRNHRQRQPTPNY